MTFVNGQTGQLVFLNNINDPWTAYTPTLTGLTGTIATARYKAIGKIGYAQVAITWLTNTAGAFIVSLPFTMATGPVTAAVPLGFGVAFDTSASQFNALQVFAASSTAVSFWNSVSGIPVNGASPMTWAAGDSLRFNIVTELA